MSAHAALVVVELLNAAGITASLKTPTTRPRGGFCRVFLLGGNDVVPAGVTVSRAVEVEAWNPRPTPAVDLAEAAVSAILAAAGTRGIRHARVESHIDELPTGEAGWERYRFAVRLEFRQPKERISR